MQCPKCHGLMRTYNRSGVQIEQCDNCRGIFLDYGELESLTQLESRMMHQAPPPAPPAGYAQPAWGAAQPPVQHHYYHHGHHGPLARLFFSS